MKELIKKEIENLEYLGSTEYWGSTENIENENKIFGYYLEKKLITQDWLDSRLKHTNIERLEELLKQ